MLNRVYRLVWNHSRSAYMVASEVASSSGKKSSLVRTGRQRSHQARVMGSMAVMMVTGALALPQGAQVVAGQASMAQTSQSMTITQSTPKAIINWSSFGIAGSETVNFVQPGATSIILNRVVGQDPSQIYGHLNANGQVFLVNPNGILFARGASVDVGGLVASTLNVSDSNFLAGKLNFTGVSQAQVDNQGQIQTADAGYVALLGAHVSNVGRIVARLGSVDLAAGQGITLDLANDGLLTLSVDQGAYQALVANGGIIEADGGQVLLTTQAAQSMLDTVVNNTGVIQAQTITHHAGRIALMGDMNSGTVNVGGTLDASAPNGGNGGSIETSAAHVKVADAAVITTQAAQGANGNWLIDPVDFTVASLGGDITGSALSTLLNSSSVTIQTTSGTNTASNLYANGTTGSGNINIKDAVTWSANTLTLNAYNNININAAMNGSGTAALALLYGQGSSTGVISGVTANFNANAPVNLPDGNNLTEKLGSSGVTNTFDVLNKSTNILELNALQGMALSGNYALGTSIDASMTSTWNLGTGFIPVGNGTSPFTGNFDGLGHTISGLNTSLIVVGNSVYAGLFGYSSGTLQNVGLVGGQIKAIDNNNASSTATGGVVYVGQLVGFSAGTVNNSYASGTVGGYTLVPSSSVYAGGLVGYANSSSPISNSYATGTVTADTSTTAYDNWNILAGGLVGESWANVSNSHATGDVASLALSAPSISVFSNAVYAGGLIGNQVSGLVTNSYAAGSVQATGLLGYVGGLVGNSSGAISGSYATGVITGTEQGDNHNANASTMDVGGLVGSNSVAAGGIDQSYATGSVSTSAVGTGNTIYAGALAGVNPGTIQNSYATGGVSSSATTSTVYDGGLVGYNASNGSINNSYATGLVQNTTSANIYAAGLVSKNAGLISGSFWDTTTSASQTGVSSGSTAGSRGMATADMQNALNYTGATAANGNLNPGWDLSNVWDIYSGHTYPLLRSFMTPLTVTAQNLTVTYSAVANTGDVNGIACSGGTCPTQHFYNATGFSGSSQGAINTGTYVINSSVYSDQQGYVITFVPGSLVINPATLTVSAGNASRAYGQANPTVAPTYTGFMGSDSVTTALTAQPTIVSSAVLTSPVGSYVLTPQGAASSNYIFNYVPGSLTISQAILAMTANATTSTYGLALPTFTGYLSGLVNGDTQATVSTGTLTFTSPASITSDVGAYAINGSGLTLTNSNYQLAQAAGNATALTVNPLPLTVQVQGNKVFDGTTALNNPVFTSNALSTNPVTIQGTAVYATTAGMGVAINASGLTFSGAHAADYSLVSTTATGSGNITPAPYFDAPSAPTSASVTPTPSNIGLVQAVQEVIHGEEAQAVAAASMHVVLPGSDSQALLTVTGDGMRWPQ